MAEKVLTHWGRVTHICVGNLNSIGSDNGLAPTRWQAIIWTNAGILLTGPLWTNFNEILIEIQTFSFKKMRMQMSSGKWRPFCIGLNVLTFVLLRSYIQLHLQQIWNTLISLFKTPVSNLSPPGQNGCHSTDDIFRCIFMNENFCILIKISLNFVF